MAYLGNSPLQETVLRLEARKSFALGLRVCDSNGLPLDITSASLEIVMRKLPLAAKDPQDSKNLIWNSLALRVDPEGGVAMFHLQASDLDHAPGEYAFAIVMHVQSYSTVVVKGVIDLQQNTEFSSTLATYTPADAPYIIQITAGDRNSISLLTGPSLAPGTTSFRDADKSKLDAIEARAQVNVMADWDAHDELPSYIHNKPVLGSAAFLDIETLGVPQGGTPGEVLVKLSAEDFHVGWVQLPSGGPGGGGGTLPAEGVPAGYLPIATGTDSWRWGTIVSGVSSVNGKVGEVKLTLDSLNDTANRIAMAPAERDKLQRLKESLAYSDLEDPPTLGTAAAQNTEAFLQPGEVTTADISEGVFDPARIPAISTLKGISSGLSDPTGGEDGDIYFQYTDTP